jgi:hypothetical protein
MGARGEEGWGGEGGGQGLRNPYRHHPKPNKKYFYISIFLVSIQSDITDINQVIILKFVNLKNAFVMLYVVLGGHFFQAI